MTTKAFLSLGPGGMKLEFEPDVQDTATPVTFETATDGWVIELEKNVWLVSADADPSRCLKLENATRWPTERSARRAMSRVRKLCSKKFHGATIYNVK